MNIFYLDTDSKKAASMHCDKHVVKMVLESTQILCTVFNKKGIIIPGSYSPTHRNHPCVLWVEKSFGNFKWLLSLALHLSTEYTLRYNKIHKCHSILCTIENYFTNDFNPTMWKMKNFSKPPQCMPDKYKQDNTVEAYRAYYKGEKAKFAKWAHSNKPEWW